MAKHSRSTVASLKLGIKGDNIELVIKDNGGGFDVDNKRVELKGIMKVYSGINNGTRIEILIPKSSFKE